MTDLELARRCMKDNKMFRQSIYEVHRVSVAKRIKRLGVPDQDLSDFVQETFLKIKAGLRTYSGDRPLEHWIMRIVRNNVIDYWRRTNRRPEGYRADYNDEFRQGHRHGGASEGMARDPARMLEHKQMVQAMYRALDAVSHELRQTATLYLEGRKYKEISKLLGIPEGTVASRVKSFKQKAARYIADAGGGRLVP